MDELDPIRQLQHLLDDPGKLLEKISGIQSALGSIRPAEPTTAEDTPTPTLPTDAVNSTSEAPNRRYSRALETLRAIQTQLQERLRPLAERTVQERIRYLAEQTKNQQGALGDCLAKIDQCVAKSIDRFDLCHRTYAELVALNRRLVELGAESQDLSKYPMAQSLTDTINLRIRSLQQAGKI